MLLQHSETEEPARTTPMHVPTSVMIPALEIYLDRVYVPSLTVDSEIDATVQRSIMRDRLYSAVELQESLGLPRQQAIASVLRDVEAALQVTAIKSATSTTLRQHGQQQSARDLAMALGLFGVPFYLDATRVSGAWWETHAVLPDGLFYGLELFSVPVLAGAILGLAARHNAGKTAYRALFTLAIIGLVARSMVAWLWPQLNDAMWGQFANSAGVGIGPWLVLGCLSAWSFGHVKACRLNGHRAAASERLRNRLARLKPTRDALAAVSAFSAAVGVVLYSAFGHNFYLNSNDYGHAYGHWLFGAAFCAPAVAGALVGMVSAKSPRRAVIGAMKAFAIPLVVAPSILAAVETVRTGGSVTGIAVQMMAGMIGWWTISGCAGAWVGQHIRGFSRRHLDLQVAD